MNWKKYWGLIPAAAAVVLTAAALWAERATGLELRNAPKMLLFWLDFLSALALIFWVGCRVFAMKKMEQFRGRQTLKTVLFLLFAFFTAAAMSVVVFLCMFTYQSERVVERNGIRMVATVNNYLETVSYYEYKNPLLRGTECIGYEDYSNADENADSEDWEPKGWFFKDLDGNVIESGGDWAVSDDATE